MDLGSQLPMRRNASNSHIDAFSGENLLLRPLLLVTILLPIALWTACGGGGGGNSGGNPGGGGGGGGGNGGGGTVNAPTVVSVSAGQAVSGVNISVAAQASSPTPNATAAGADGSHAFSGGDVMHQNSVATLIVFGPGLTTSMKASFSGPSDIAIGPLQSVKFTDPNAPPGLRFTATVASNAALGARTLVLQDTKNDITTFSGALEVVP
jgi:hypothetical protein